MAEITNLPQYQGEHNLPGYLGYKFIPLSEVTDVPDHRGTYNINSDISLVQDKFWRAGYGTMGTLELNEDPQVEGGITRYRQVLKGFIPRDVPDLTRLMEAMKHNRFLVLAKNAEGDERLLGDLQNGMHFTYQFSSRKIGDRQVKGYSYEFYRTSREPAPFYYATASVSFGQGGSNDLTYIVSFEPGTGTRQHTITAQAAGTLSTQSLDNVDTVSYELNGNSVSLPFSPSVGDTFTVNITQTDDQQPSSVTLNGTY